MKAVIDNNLPVTLCARLRALLPDQEIDHVRLLGLQDRTDDELRRYWNTAPIVWITRDEDFWLSAPPAWAVAWVSCHNPRLPFIHGAIALMLARSLPTMASGRRLLISEQMATLM